VASVTKVKKRYGETNSWLVVRYRGGSAWIDTGEDQLELVRRLLALNPAIKTDERIFK
jgi:hypothetical protein